MGQDTGRLQRSSRVGFRENGPCRKEQQKLALEGSKKGPWKGLSGDRKFQGAGEAGQKSPCKHGVAYAQD